MKPKLAEFNSIPFQLIHSDFINGNEIQNSLMKLELRIDGQFVLVSFPAFN